MVHNIIKRIISLVIVIITVTTSYSQPNFIYEGGPGNGYAMEEHSENSTMIYAGSEGSGYTIVEESENSTMIYEGSQGNGYVSFQLTSAFQFLYEGSEEDGYSSILYMPPFIWTGAIGQSWTIAGNWNFNAVPGISRVTIIPVVAEGNAYPHINAGLFSIGLNPNNGAYKSGELWIQEGALLVTRVNCKIENYGSIIVDGEMRVRNPASDAFINMAEGEVQVNSTGLWRFN